MPEANTVQLLNVYATRSCVLARQMPLISLFAIGDFVLEYSCVSFPWFCLPHKNIFNNKGFPSHGIVLLASVYMYSMHCCSMGWVGVCTLVTNCEQVGHFFFASETATKQKMLVE